MVAGDDLERPFALVAEDGEIANELQEVGALEDAAQKRVEFRRTGRGVVGAIDGAPGHVALFVGGERADARFYAVGDDERGVGAKQRGDFGLVGFELADGGGKRRVFVAGVFQLQQSERQAVDEKHNVGAAVLAPFDHRELIDDEPVIGLRIEKIDQPDFGGDKPAGVFVLDIDALGEETMQAAVFLDEIGRLIIENAADGVSARFLGNGRIDVGDAGFEAFDEDGVLEGGALRGGTVGGNVAAMEIGPAKRFERLDAGMFNMVLGEAETYGSSPGGLALKLSSSSSRIRGRNTR